MTHPVLKRRRHERQALVEIVARWAPAIAGILRPRAVVVVGSVARGDFNQWSDIDVLIVVDRLPQTLVERLALVATAGRPPGVEAIVWTPAELAERRRRGHDPIANEAYEVGVVVHGALPADAQEARPLGESGGLGA